MDEVPSDAYLVIEFLLEECGVSELPAVALQSQIYTLIPDKTEVEGELDELRQSFEIRIFQLRTDKKDVAILFNRDHEQDLLAIAQSLPPQEGEILMK